MGITFNTIPLHDLCLFFKVTAVPRALWRLIEVVAVGWRYLACVEKHKLCWLEQTAYFKSYDHGLFFAE